MPSLGVYQISEVYQREVTKTGEESYHLIQKPDGLKQESIDSEAVFDEMNTEQTWPTEQEIKEAQLKTIKKKVPKGTSDYQAAWILDSDDVDFRTHTIMINMVIS